MDNKRFWHLQIRQQNGYWKWSHECQSFRIRQSGDTFCDLSSSQRSSSSPPPSPPPCTLPPPRSSPADPSRPVSWCHSRCCCSSINADASGLTPSSTKRLQPSLHWRHFGYSTAPSGHLQRWVSYQWFVTVIKCWRPNILTESLGLHKRVD